MVAAGIAWRLVYGMFMGWADRLAGMTAGLAVGAVMAGAAVIGMAGLSHATSSLNEGVAGKVLAYTPYDADDFSGLEATLTESVLVSAFVSAAAIIPDKAIDVAPESMQDALDRLERSLERKETGYR